MLQMTYRSMFVSAVKHGDHRRLDLLLSALLPGSCSDDLDFAFYEACIAGSTECCRILLQKGADVNGGSRKGDPPVLVAASQGHHDLIRLLLSADCSTKGLLHRYAAYSSSDRELVKMIIAAGAKVNALDADGFTPLMRAVSKKNYAMVETLVKEGADMDIKGRNDWTALHLAAKSGFCAQLLIEGGANLDARDNHGNTPLILASCEGFCKVIAELCEAGCDVNAENHDGSTALHILTMKGHVECVEQLALAGADIFRDKEGMIPINWAMRYERSAMVVFYLRAIGNYSVFEEKHQAFPLTHAIILGLDDVVATLLDVGCCKGQDTFRESAFSFFAFGSDKVISLSTRHALMTSGSNPLTLKQLARLAIRRCMTDVKVLTDCDLLPIPTTLQHYVSLKYLS